MAEEEEVEDPAVSHLLLFGLLPSWASSSLVLFIASLLGVEEGASCGAGTGCGTGTRSGVGTGGEQGAGAADAWAGAEVGGGVLLSALTIRLSLCSALCTSSIQPKTTLFSIVYVIICFVFRVI